MNKKGFTLIELIIVIAIIAILASIAFVAVNPAKRIGEANDDQRWADLTSIAEAWQKYTADNPGSTALTSLATVDTVYEISGTWTDDDCTATTTTTSIDLSTLVSSGYLGSVPEDPLEGGLNGASDYWFTRSGNSITVGACEKYSGANSYPTVTR